MKENSQIFLDSMQKRFIIKYPFSTKHFTLGCKTMRCMGVNSMLSFLMEEGKDVESINFPIIIYTLVLDRLSMEIIALYVMEEVIGLQNVPKEPSKVN